MSEQYNEILILSHKYCFICQRPAKYTKLHEVSEATIAQAYLKHNLIIKSKSRCCGKHLDSDSNIKEDQYSFIPTKPCSAIKNFSSIIQAIVREVSTVPNTNPYIFQNFNDTDTLDEELCIKITGWTKAEFIRFCEMITSINDSKNRTKEQLVALYRYWLRKGALQQSIAYMFGENTTQQQISHYLEQIRRAIYKDFVPHFLGCHFGRDFFTRHNSKMFDELHSLHDTDLSIVVDGTYTRCEKSADNQFQYNSYSDQKKDSLIKPFLVCTADGYIIDCYGPFQANFNDAKIFEYILNSDNELLEHLQSSKTLVFMDRGNIEIKK